jgi:nicotinamide-nucleotide amidase
MNKKNKLQNIINHLRIKNQTISFAESCTGGLLAATFSSISGVSDVFNGSVVTYSNDIKNKWLGVEQSVLDTYGAVSRECVEQMLLGVKKMAKSDYAIAISGIAGPNGGSKEKPVGTVYIGLLSPKGSDVWHCTFDGNRKDIQEASVSFAIEKLTLELDIIS